MRFFTTDKLVKLILDNCSQEEVFAHYLKIPIQDILYCLQSKSHKINNPLRDDKNPSLGFKYDHRGKLRLKDFAQPLYNGDMFDVVARVLSLTGNEYLTSNNKHNFVIICRDIIENVVNKTSVKINIPKPVIRKSKPKDIKRITVIPRDWETYDFEYWRQFGLSVKFLTKNHVVPVKYVYLDLEVPVYYSTQSDRCYCYNLDHRQGVNIVKLYFIDRRKGIKMRFITNNHYVFDDAAELKPTPYLIITKSRKDVLVIKNLLDNKLVSVVSISSESVKLTKLQVSGLQSIYKQIIVITDGDVTGALFAFYHHRQFNLSFFLIGNIRYISKGDRELINHTAQLLSNMLNEPVTVEEIYAFFNKIFESKVKDIADYYKKYGRTKTLELLTHILKSSKL
jgi:uncharacterized protein (DUF433 family)